VEEVLVPGTVALQGTAVPAIMDLTHMELHLVLTRLIRLVPHLVLRQYVLISIVQKVVAKDKAKLQLRHLY
jgi:hypothetical protein